MSATVVGHSMQHAPAEVHLAGLLVLCAVAVSVVIELLRTLSSRHRWPAWFRWVAIVVVLSITAQSAPAEGSADEPDAEVAAGLPDLISDPPHIWATKTVIGADGERRRVLTFDGHLRNIGEGVLHVSGNPQVEGDVRQRVFDGDEWHDVATPTVRFETDDGHSHFHLIAAADYSLWDDARAAPIAPGAKVGFCLVDVELIDGERPARYPLDPAGDCRADDPGATDLRMGITPGWRDTYDSTTTLQWIDISAIPPGRYWVGAVADPNDEIVESDETNNELVFSDNRFSVPGYVARQLPVQAAGSITLAATPYGTVGDPAFVIAEGPSNGSLDVPVGVDLFDPMVRYTPAAGFMGVDEFSYYVHDINAEFPQEHATVTVRVEVDQRREGPAPATPGPEASSEASSDAMSIELVELDTFSSVRMQVDSLLGVDAEIIGWYAAGLPPGLRVDAMSATVIGTPTASGEYTSSLVAVTPSGRLTYAVTWQVRTDLDNLPALIPLNDFSTAIDEDFIVEVGFVRPGSTYVARGFPLGATVAVDLPQFIGTPTEIGDFAVEVDHLVDGELAETVEFLWTVRPGAFPAFVL